MSDGPECECSGQERINAKYQGQKKREAAK
jgi:hypothetical protein